MWYARQVAPNQYRLPGRAARNWGLDTVEGDLSAEELDSTDTKPFCMSSDIVYIYIYIVNSILSSDTNFNRVKALFEFFYYFPAFHEDIHSVRPQYEQKRQILYGQA